MATKFEVSSKDKEPKGLKEGSKREEALDTKQAANQASTTGANPLEGPDNWRAQSDVHTLTEAHRIKSDPKRHAAAISHAKGQLKAMRAVAQPATPGPKSGM